MVLIDDDTQQIEDDQKAQPIFVAPNANTTAPGFGVNPIIPGVGPTPGSSNKDSNGGTLADPHLPNIEDHPK